MSKDKIVIDCAEKLIDTLGSMPADEADAIVREVATTLMNDVVGKKGYVKSDLKAILCGSQGAKKVITYK